MPEPHGFRAFVEARYPSLVRFGTLLCGDPDRGEHLVQESLIKTLRGWTRVGLGEGDPEAHTRTVMTHAALRGSRRRWWGERRTGQLPEQLDVAVSDAFTRVGTADAARAVLATLPAQQRVVLVLLFSAHLTEAETAVELGCTTGTVRSHAGRAVAALRGTGLLDETAGGGGWTDDERIELLLTRAAQATPTSSRPADDVLQRADRAPSARRRRRLRVLIGGLVAVGLVAGGVALSGRGGSTPAPAPPPIRLTVDLPPGWHYDDSGLVLTCASNLAPRTVYRGATIGDLRCPADQQPTISGPVLAAGRLDRLLAERVRTTGSPTTVGQRAAWVESGDTPYALATYLVAGTEDAGYVVVAPHGTGPEEPVAPSLQGEDVWTVPAEVLAAASGVRVRGGERFRRHQLPRDVRAAVLTVEPRNVAAAPGALVWSRHAAREVLHDLRPARRALPPCGEPVSARTLWLQRIDGSWVRVDVTTDAAGCRAAVSELGGVGRVAGNPAGLARVRDEGEPRNQVTADSRTVGAGGITFTVPDGWRVFEESDFDPCTATTPTVVLADSLAPSCLVDVGQRAYQPYLWMTTRPLETMLFPTDAGATLSGKPRQVRGRDGSTISWSKEMLLVDGTTFQGWLGIPVDESPGRLLLMGVPWQSGATALERLAGSS